MGKLFNPSELLGKVFIVHANNDQEKDIYLYATDVIDNLYLKCKILIPIHEILSNPVIEELADKISNKYNINYDTLVAFLKQSVVNDKNGQPYFLYDIICYYYVESEHKNYTVISEINMEMIDQISDNVFNIVSTEASRLEDEYVDLYFAFESYMDEKFQRIVTSLIDEFLEYEL